MLGGLCLLLKNTRWQKKAIGGVHLLLILFMFGCVWRIFFMGKLVSSRYSALLIYPCVLFSSYFLALVFQKNWRIHRFQLSGRKVFVLLISAVTIFTCAKLMRVHQSVLKQTGQIVKGECGNVSGIILCNKEEQRLAYYSGIKALKIPLDIKSSPIQFIQILKRNIRYFYHCADTIFVVLILDRKQPGVEKLLYSDSDFHILASLSFQHGSSKRVIVAQWKTNYAEYLRDMVKIKVENGDFSNILSSAEAEKIREGLLRRNIHFFEDKSIIFPRHWSFYSKDPFSQAYLSMDHENRALQIFTERSFSVSYAVGIPFTDDLEFLQFSAKGDPQTHVTVKVWNLTSQKDISEHHPIAEIQVGKQVKIYQIPLKGCSLRIGMPFSFEIVIKKGSVMLDDFVLLKRLTQKQD